MTVLGVVGHSEEKFNKYTGVLARMAIREAIRETCATRIVSGGCHMGGVDIWAEQEAKEHGLPLTVYKPTNLSWGATGGFKERNLKIARDSDAVLVVVVKELPEGFAGMRFKDCYHCKGRNPPHVKSGGCWTAWQNGNGIWRIIELPK